MQINIRTLTEKKFVGKQMQLSFAQFNPAELWQSFMPKRKEIAHQIGTELYDISVFPEHFFENFNPTTPFQKWAAIEVSDWENIPVEMDKILIESGLYAVFQNKGLETDNTTFEYIFSKWIPNSDYVVDDRPHFDVLGENYKRGDANSESEIWIPIRLKKA